jgi:signal transduction histidine kinase
MAQLLHRVDSLAAARAGLAQSLTELEASRSERDRLQAQLDALRVQAEKDRSQAESLAALLKAQPEAPPAGISNLQGELRLALEEIARLTTALAQAQAEEPRLPAANGRLESPALPGEKLASIAGELSRPAASVVEYASLLLNGSPSALDTSQRRFLERIKASGERMRSLVEELHGALTAPVTRPPGRVDLPAAVEAAASRASAAYQEKDLILRRDLPSDLPAITADSATLERLLYALLEDAAAATPQSGLVSLSARLQQETGQPDYLLVRVTDGGEAIPTGELSRLLTDTASAAQASGRSLASARARAEALHGRLWVDSHTGGGNTVNLLLPLSPADLAARDELPLPSWRKRAAAPESSSKEAES